MSYDTDRERSIAISVALNNSATLAAALVDADSTADTVLGDYANISATLVPLVLDHHAIRPLTADEAQAVVSDVFPGAVVATPQTYTQAAALVASQPAAGPAAIPGAKDPDWLWKEYFADPSAFYDNRLGKKNPNSADFASKKHVNDKGFKEGLWLTGKFPLTPWVRQELVNRGILS